MRNIRIASVSFLMEDSTPSVRYPHSIELNLGRAKEYIRQASEANAHIVCLPETVTTNGVESPETHVAESNEWASFFGETARAFGITVIAPFYAKDEDKIFNQANVFGANGERVGVYRKAQPTGAEAKWVTPGDSFPIVDIGIARIGIMICMDIYFAEIARIYAMKGAEIIFWPTVTHGPTQSGLESQIRTRAMDNSLYLVESNLAGHPPYAPYNGRFYPGNARIVDFNGEIIAQTGRRAGLAIADINLDERRVTEDVLLINDRDDTRTDLEAIARMDIYAREYAAIAAKQQRYYDTLKRS
ncbi:MAG TPA: carbon-nitrogen hydrolase family protein [Candidatus Kapabacteria bacterium]|jgi:predicted amidohydrolase|nr:carbon-nitrogen hydrolase family protein [Candidatus Kapabacteria bacterium]